MDGRESVGRPAPDTDRHGAEGLLLEERITIAAAVLVDLSILVLSALGQAWDLFVLNLCIVAVVLGVAALHRRLDSTWARIFRDWYVPAFLIVIFLENRRLIPLFNPRRLDALLMRLDSLIFLGHSPLLLMERITTPVLTEILQLSYVSFYFLPFCLCLDIYRKRPPEEFHVIASTILTGFYLSYLGYYLTPVVGPRFTLGQIPAVPLQGMFLADAVRGLIEAAEGRMPDCFPSGHAMISLLTILLARRYARGFFPLAVAWFLVIQVSTVYLRYHYVADLAAGWVLGALVYRFGPPLAKALIRRDPG
jgi:membrane-associated phospholipid phosphatase